MLVSKGVWSSFRVRDKGQTLKYNLGALGVELGMGVPALELVFVA